jgi:hypothetical protein
MWLWARPEQLGMLNFQQEIGIDWLMVQALRINAAISQASY